MAKRKSTAPVTFNKRAFLLPKMEVTEHGFYVRDLGGFALLEFKEKVEKLGDVELNASNGLELMALLVIRGTCDKSGHPVFTDDDIHLLIDKPMIIYDLSQKILKLSGMPDSLLLGLSEIGSEIKNAPRSLPTTESPTS